MLKKRVEILRTVRKTGTISKNSGSVEYETAGWVHADVQWKKGVRNLSQGAFDAQDTVMFRMRYNNIVKRDSFIRYEGVIYQIESYHSDYQDNTIQITAIETVAN